MKIDDLEFVFLKHVRDELSGPVQDLRSIESIWISDKRDIVEHKVLGSEASVLQDLGRRSARFAFAGEFIGPDAKNAIERLWQKFQAGQILPFSSNIVGLSGITQVAIEQLDFEEMAGGVNSFRYRIFLREWKDRRPRLQR